MTTPTPTTSAKRSSASGTTVASDPYPKAKQLAQRASRRYRRVVATPKQWAEIRAAKGTTCRLRDFDLFHAPGCHYHHLVPRGRSGDDVPANLVPLCPNCHTRVTQRNRQHLEALAYSLTDAEYAYCVAKLGEGALSRLFGV